MYVLLRQCDGGEHVGVRRVCDPRPVAGRRHAWEHRALLILWVTRAAPVRRADRPFAGWSIKKFVRTTSGQS
jgi:hypothetical protein